MTRNPGRPHNDGKLATLIKRATEHDRMGEFASLLGVTRHAVYKWNEGDDPSLYWQTQINALCRKLRLSLIYKVKDRNFIKHGGIKQRHAVQNGK